MLMQAGTGTEVSTSTGMDEGSDIHPALSPAQFGAAMQDTMDTESMYSPGIRLGHAAVNAVGAVGAAAGAIGAGVVSEVGKFLKGETKQVDHQVSSYAPAIHAALHPGN